MHCETAAPQPQSLLGGEISHCPPARWPLILLPGIAACTLRIRGYPDKLTCNIRRAVGTHAEKYITGADMTMPGTWKYALGFAYCDDAPEPFIGSPLQQTLYSYLQIPIMETYIHRYIDKYQKYVFGSVSIDAGNINASVYLPPFSRAWRM